MSQLIAYDSEKDLLPVMLANCSYSLEVGKETQLQYNWETLEKQVIDRFIRGRPLVEFKVSIVLIRHRQAKIWYRYLTKNQTMTLRYITIIPSFFDLLNCLHFAAINVFGLVRVR